MTKAKRLVQINYYNYYDYNNNNVILKIYENDANT